MRIFVLTATYELRVSRKNHLRDHPIHVSDLNKTIYLSLIQTRRAICPWFKPDELPVSDLNMTSYLPLRTRTAGATAVVSMWGGRARPWCSASVSWATSDQAAASSHPRMTRTSSMDSTPKSKKKGLNNFHLYNRRLCAIVAIRARLSAYNASFFMTGKLAIGKRIISRDGYLLERNWYHYSNITRATLMFTLVTETNYAYNLFILL